MRARAPTGSDNGDCARRTDDSRDFMPMSTEPVLFSFDRSSMRLSSRRKPSWLRCSRFICGPNVRGSARKQEPEGRRSATPARGRRVVRVHAHRKAEPMASSKQASCAACGGSRRASAATGPRLWPALTAGRPCGCGWEGRIGVPNFLAGTLCHFPSHPQHGHMAVGGAEKRCHGCQRGCPVGAVICDDSRVQSPASCRTRHQHQRL